MTIYRRHQSHVTKLQASSFKLQALPIGRPTGMIALASVIVVSAILLIVGLAAAYIGQTEIILAGDADWDQTARYAANACLEESLLRLKRDAGYVGGTVTVSGQTCTVTVTGSGTTRTITSVSSVSGYVKSVQVAASRRGNGPNNASGWHVDSYVELDPP